MMSSPPDIIHWSPRSGDHGDCGVVGISLATGATYEEVLRACVAVRPSVLEDGLTKRDIKKILTALRFESRSTKKVDLDEDTGLLIVSQKKGDWHLVYLWAGRVINPSRADRTALWLNADDYIKEGEWTVEGLILVGKKSDK